MSFSSCVQLTKAAWKRKEKQRDEQICCFATNHPVFCVCVFFFMEMLVYAYGVFIFLFFFFPRTHFIHHKFSFYSYQLLFVMEFDGYQQESTEYFRLTSFSFSFFSFCFFHSEEQIYLCRTMTKKQKVLLLWFVTEWKMRALYSTFFFLLLVVVIAFTFPLNDNLIWIAY